MTDQRETELKIQIEKMFGPISYSMTAIVSPIRPLLLNVIEPDEKRPYYTIVTSGLSEEPLVEGLEEASYEEAFAELLIKLPPDWPMDLKGFVADDSTYWPIGVMRVIAALPAEINSYFIKGTILPNNGESPPKPYAINTKLSWAMISKPQDESLAVYHASNGDPINFYVINYLYQEEAEFAFEYGSEHFRQLFQAKGVSEVLDINRANLIPLAETDQDGDLADAERKYLDELNKSVDDQE